MTHPDLVPQDEIQKFNKMRHPKHNPLLVLSSIRLIRIASYFFPQKKEQQQFLVLSLSSEYQYRNLHRS